ncbi:MAG: DUF3817 domain-containing protein [Betaproteobacteria bacterium]|nr:MAG: DUF3817 domain-containing protein [Betaproteobacteria bacterium]
MAYRGSNCQNLLRIKWKYRVRKGGSNLIFEQHNPLHRLRLAALIEGITLLSLLFIAVPLKHLMGMPATVSIVGPIHGLAFVFYLWTVVNTAVSEDWSKGQIALSVAMALLPFGAFVNAKFLMRKNVELDQSCST